jgi:hypothetical protein
MRRIAGIVALVALVVIFAADARAQGLGEEQEETYLRIPHRFTIFLDAGIAVPTQPGPWRDSWDTGFPFAAGVGLAVFGWLDVNFVASYASFGVNELEAKRQIGFMGVSEIQGGSITTIRYLGTARFIAVPSHRFNPYAAVGVGYFNTSAEDLTITGHEPNNPQEMSWTNTMESVSGLSINFGFGGQYALNERWSAFTQFIWTINQNGDFAPSNLLLDEDETAYSGQGSQHIATISVGLMIRI